VADIGSRHWVAAVRSDQPDEADGRAHDGAGTPDANEARDASAAADLGDAGRVRAVRFPIETV